MKLLDEIRAYNGTLTYQELLELVERINHRVNTRGHKGTGKIPILYYEKEKASLSWKHDLKPVNRASSCQKGRADNRIFICVLSALRLSVWLFDNCGIQLFYID